MPDNIVLNAVNKKTIQSLLNFQTGISAAVHATVEIKQLISHTKTAIVDTIISLQDSGWEVIQFHRHTSYLKWFMTF